MKNFAPLFAAAATAILLATATIGEATTRYVAQGGGNTPPFTNWTQAATTIQAAVNASQAGDTVIVTNGLYTVTTQISVTNSITVKSLNGWSTTTVKGGYPATSNRCFYLASTGAVVNGFTITNGYVTGTSGGGVVFANGGCVENCFITGNRAGPGLSYGGGAAFHSSGTISNCSLVGNQSTDSTYGRGGAIFIGGGGVTVANCTVSNNSAANTGGIFSQASAVIMNCLVCNNADTGLGLGNGSLARNCLVIRNGNGIGLSNGARAENCTVSQTTGPRGVWQDNADCSIVNSIIWSNGAGGAQNWSGFTNFAYCCTTPLPAGDGNISSNPQFASTSNFRPWAGSPCIDTGTNQGWMATATDLDGNARIYGGAVDMGAYEWGSDVGIRFSAVDITWDAIIGRTYQPQWTTNLMGSWSNFPSSVVATSTFMYVYDWIRDNPNRSYRVIDITP